MGGSGKRGVVLATIGNLAAPLVALVTAPILARSLGLAERGELAAVLAPFLLITAGLTLGIPESMTYFVAKGRGSRRQILGVGVIASFLLGVVGAGVIAFLAPTLSAGDPELATFIAIVALTVVPAMMAGAIRGFVRGLRYWGLIALDQIVSSALRLVAIIVLVLIDQLTVLNAGLASAAATFLGIGIYLAIPRLERRVSHEVPDSASGESQSSGWGLYKGILRFGVGVWLGSSAGILLARLDQTLILPLASAEVLGVFAVAVSIADVVRVFNMAVRDVVFSLQSSEEDDEKLGLASRASTILTAGGALAIAFASYLLVPPLFGAEFTPAIPVIWALLIGTILGNPGSVAAAGLTARGKPLLRSLAILGGVVANVVALYLLVPWWGAMGAAVARGIANVITAATVIFFARRYFGLSPLLFLRFRKSDVAYLVKSLRRR